MSSCATTSHQKSKEISTFHQSVEPATNWRLVKSDPPTYIPKGYSEDSLTTHRDGEWIYAGTNGEQWFIPTNGAGRRTAEELHAEAFARQTEKQRKKQKAIFRDVKPTHLVLGAAGIAVFTPIIMAAGSGDPTGYTAKSMLESLGLE